MVKPVDRDLGKKVNLRRFVFEEYEPREVKSLLGKKALDYLKRRKNKVRVGILPKSLEKRGFVGFRRPGFISRRTGKESTLILLKKKLRGQELKRTFWHEVGHHEAKRELTKIERAKLKKEIKKTTIYSRIKKAGYTSDQAPEELLVETFAKSKVGIKMTAKEKRLFKKNLPTFNSQLKKLLKR